MDYEEKKIKMNHQGFQKMVREPLPAVGKDSRH
jgi:hypothetical protein